MSWTYVDPTTTTRDKVRFLIGDTDSTDPLLTDEEIEWLLSAAGDSIYQAAHDACYALSSKFARMATSKSVGDLSLSYQNRAQQFLAQAERLLELGARRESPTPWVSPDALTTATKRNGSEHGTEFYEAVHDYYRG